MYEISYCMKFENFISCSISVQKFFNFKVWVFNMTFQKFFTVKVKQILNNFNS